MGIEYQRYKVTREHDSDEYQCNQEKGEEKEGIMSTIYRSDKWVGSMILGLFWS